MAIPVSLGRLVEVGNANDDVIDDQSGLLATSHGIILLQLRRFLSTALVLGLLVVTSCDFTGETKIPPDPTVEYLPCTGMSLPDDEPADPAQVLSGLPAGAAGDDLAFDDNWGGEWQVGTEWHVALVDVGVVDWEAVCPQIRDPNLVVHEVPHSYNDLLEWEAALSAGATTDTTADLVIDAGQFVIEVRAPDLDTANTYTEGIPTDAWKYGGTVSGNG